MKYPKVCLDNIGNYFITLCINHKKFRLYSGDKIGIDLKPNGFPFSQRKAKVKILMIHDENDTKLSILESKKLRKT